MTLLHLLAGLVVIGACGYLVGRGLVPGEPERVREQVTMAGFAMGLAWAAVLFTGFIQLGSQNALPRTILYKLGVTGGGGMVGLLAVFAYLRGVFPRILLVVSQTLVFVGFLMSFYWGILL